jgi:hypothetical protein
LGRLVRAGALLCVLHIQRRASSATNASTVLAFSHYPAALSRVRLPNLSCLSCWARSPCGRRRPGAPLNALHRRFRVGVCAPSGRWCRVRPLDGEHDHMGHPQHVVHTLRGHQRGHRLWKPVLDRRCGGSALRVCVGSGRVRDRPFRRGELLASLHPHAVPGDSAACKWDCSLLGLRCAPPRTAPRMFPLRA